MVSRMKYPKISQTLGEENPGCMTVETIPTTALISVATSFGVRKNQTVFRIICTLV